MKRRFQLVSTLLLFFLQQCGQPKTPFDKSNSTASVNQENIDTSIYSILPYDTSSHWIFKTGIPTSLSQTELVDVQHILKKCINEYNIDQQKQFDILTNAHRDNNLNKQNFIIDLTKYKRQYFPIINHKGEKEVLVNSFCNTGNKNWRKELLIVKDGGNCYFNVIINLTKKVYYRLMVNGDA